MTHPSFADDTPTDDQEYEDLLLDVAMRIMTILSDLSDSDDDVLDPAPTPQ